MLAKEIGASVFHCSNSYVPKPICKSFGTLQHQLIFITTFNSIFIYFTKKSVTTWHKKPQLSPSLHYPAGSHTLSSAL